MTQTSQVAVPAASGACRDFRTTPRAMPSSIQNEPLRPGTKAARGVRSAGAAVLAAVSVMFVAGCVPPLAGAAVVDAMAIVRQPGEPPVAWAAMRWFDFVMAREMARIRVKLRDFCRAPGIPPMVVTSLLPVNHQNFHHGLPPLGTAVPMASAPAAAAPASSRWRRSPRKTITAATQTCETGSERAGVKRRDVRARGHQRCSQRLTGHVVVPPAALAPGLQSRQRVEGHATGIRLPLQAVEDQSCRYARHVTCSAANSILGRTSRK